MYPPPAPSTRLVHLLAALLCAGACGSHTGDVGGDDAGGLDGAVARGDAGPGGDARVASDARVTATDASPPLHDAGLVWRSANLTNFTSYPAPDSEECIVYNGCMWAGYFAFVDGKQPESWVMSHNILAVHSKDANEYRLKTLRLRMGGTTIDATVYDMCADSDCDGCCTANSAETGFLIDIEKYTMQRFGHGHGIVDWACLDCDQ